jgi:hypothetical protein
MLAPTLGTRLGLSAKDVRAALNRDGCPPVDAFVGLRIAASACGCTPARTGGTKDVLSRLRSAFAEPTALRSWPFRGDEDDRPAW